MGAISDENGIYEISGIKPGVYSFKVVVSGFKAFQINEITVTNARSVSLDFALEEIILEQQEVVVKANPFIRKIESPVSLKTLNSTEIERLPGANRDASKVIASLPGVASRATFRNDKSLKSVATHITFVHQCRARNCNVHSCSTFQHHFIVHLCAPTDYLNRLRRKHIRFVHQSRSRNCNVHSCSTSQHHFIVHLFVLQQIT